MPTPILTIANQLTILRMALAPSIVILIADRRFGWALIVFGAASLSDLLDGLIARFGHQKTNLGAMLDPVADKILLGSTLVALTWVSNLVVRIPVWVTVLVLSRDLLIIVSVVVVNLTLERRIFPPSLLGKLSTFSQIMTAWLVLFLNWLGSASAVVNVAYLATVLFGVASGLHYTYQASTHKNVEGPT
jgi:cardiolipin synthase (CMP-forming)